jgi:RHS repeat-associated protein
MRYSYDSFGLPKIISGSTLVDFRNYSGNKYSNTRLFTWREHDRETGYYYNRARYYNAENFGRFLSRDPIGQNDQVNLYAYVANSPLKYVDRMGRGILIIIFSYGYYLYCRDTINTLL